MNNRESLLVVDGVIIECSSKRDFSQREVGAAQAVQDVTLHVCSGKARVYFRRAVPARRRRGGVAQEYPDPG